MASSKHERHIRDARAVAEMPYQKLGREAYEKVAAALLLPLPESEDAIWSEGNFDPWDLFPSLYGSYDSEFDKLALDVLADVLHGTQHRDDLAGQMFREMLCTANLCDYGSSPRICFPNPGFRKILPDLIYKWQAFSMIQWGRLE